MLALPGVSEGAIRRTHPSWLRQGRSGLPLPTVHANGAVVRVCHRQ
jgi:hypothetical protein